ARAPDTVPAPAPILGTPPDRGTEPPRDMARPEGRRAEGRLDLDLDMARVPDMAPLRATGPQLDTAPGRRPGPAPGRGTGRPPGTPADRDTDLASSQAQVPARPQGPAVLPATVLSLAAATVPRAARPALVVQVPDTTLARGTPLVITDLAH